MQFNPNRNSLTKRLLAPRIIVYVILALAMAWVVHRYENSRRLEGISQKSLSREVRLVNPEMNGLPMIVVVPQPGQELEDEVAASQKDLAGKCHVSMLTVVDGEAIKKLFNLKKLPAALLYDVENREIGRVDDGQVSAEILKKLANGVNP